MVEIGRIATIVCGAVCAALVQRWLRHRGHDLSFIDRQLLLLCSLVLFMAIYSAALRLAGADPNSGRLIEDDPGDTGSGSRTRRLYPLVRELLVTGAIFLAPLAVLSIVQMRIGRQLSDSWALLPFALLIIAAAGVHFWRKLKPSPASSEEEGEKR